MGDYSPIIKETFTAVIRNIGEEIHQYLLTCLPNIPTEGGYHEIEVRDPQAGVEGDHAHAGYWSAAKPQ